MVSRAVPSSTAATSSTCSTANSPTRNKASLIRETIAASRSPAKGLPPTRSDGCKRVGLVPGDPGHLAPAPLAPFPADTGKDSLGGGPYGRLLSHEARLEADGGDHLRGHGRRLPAVMERGEIGGQRGVGGRASFERVRESLQGSLIGKARVLGQAGLSQVPSAAGESIQRAGCAAGRGEVGVSGGFPRVRFTFHNGNYSK